MLSASMRAAAFLPPSPPERETVVLPKRRGWSQCDWLKVAVATNVGLSFFVVMLSYLLLLWRHV